MTTRNRKVGGKGKRAKDTPPRPKKPPLYTVPVDCYYCGKEYPQPLTIGTHQITLICDGCGKTTTEEVTVNPDGHGMIIYVLPE